MTTDVNEGFQQSKLEQITKAGNPVARIREDLRAGRLKALGGNRFQVVGGYDAGETLFINLAALEAGALTAAEAIRSDHGLDTLENGQVALYLKDTPAWHSLGTVIAGGSTDMTEILKLAGLFWTTELRRVVFFPEEDADRFEWENPAHDRVVEPELKYSLRHCPDKYVTIRSDTREAMGVVGSRYTPIHNHQAFLFLEALFEHQDMICETAGSMNGGADVFLSAEIPGELLVDPKGIADQIRMFLMIRNSHDGRSPLVSVVTPWRPLCKNTERFAVRDAVSSWTVRHTASAMDRVKEASRALGLTTNYYEEWLKEEESLVAVPFGYNDVDQLISDIWGEIPEDVSQTKATRRENTRATLHSLFGLESERAGRNAYAAERAVTGFLDHHSTRNRKDGVTPLELLGQAIVGQNETMDKTKNKAHKLLMNRVK